MSDKLAEKLAEAKKKMFGDLHTGGSKITLIVVGEANIVPKSRDVVIKRV